ncbi:Crp/Fnr family transcriptional regulator [Sphingobacterium sp. 2149]|uniref:Crp/Fnr family transcriptional regulator n=1 Tax=Sphingobacterium sp. 2149 TaxID=2817763 RepID=UPI002860B5D1|nr:Crp/Fnr family transcriptional regulator [Sphingobacterium sp. 2149]MDR6736270.1 CRP-like cAMP-binding protein [Sphingobacterium sp. 2149]
MELIRKYFERRFELTDHDWQAFYSKLTRQNFPKKHILLKSGQIENNLSFIETGIVRFYIPKEENDLTFSFAFNNNFVSGYNSFLTRNPSTYYIETLTETTLWQLTFDDLQEIYKKTKIGNAIGRQASEELFLKKSQRELSLLNETAERRYLNLFTERPELIKEIPLKYIASYIGITPQALSRIRRRIS